MTPEPVPAASKRVLFVSNGHGEDDIACKVIDRLRRFSGNHEIQAWPMVGAGKAYRERGLPVVGASNLLPSEGFATLDLKLLIKDLRHGWIGTHLRQLRTAVGLRGRYDLIVGTGDIMPLLVGYLSKAPFAFIGCAKSAYYAPGYTYTRLERIFMRRCRGDIFPRDSKTCAELEAQGTACHDLGNPMMDGLEEKDPPLRLPGGDTAIALLPGTRQDLRANAIDLLEAAAAIAGGNANAGMKERGRLVFLFPIGAGTDPRALGDWIGRSDRATGWQPAGPAIQGFENEEALSFSGPGGAAAVLVAGRFADVLRASCLAVGMAGTANEQAVGVGLPLVCVPSSGVQGAKFVAMKMQYFGDSAIRAERDPHDVAKHVWALLSDPDRCRRMALAGQERMGRPGASAAIARRIADRLR